MTIYGWLILAFWLVFIAVWIVAAIGAKRNVQTGAWRRQIGLRWAIAVLLVLALQVPDVRHALQSAQSFAVVNTFMATVGTAICALGMGFAIWARVFLGRNWGVPMSRKENPELVTTGPYAFVRHPIYTGVMFAMLGSAIGESPVWILAVIPFGAYFVYSARREEKLMLEQFPERYPAYMKQTTMLLPFLF